MSRLIFPLVAFLTASFAGSMDPSAQERPAPVEISQADPPPIAEGDASRETSPKHAATHVIATETAFYRTGPQQAHPADGKFAAGTKVELVRTAGSYSLVRSLGGEVAYVATDSLKPMDSSGKAADVNADIDKLVQGNNAFAIDLYQSLRAGESGNLFFSPQSISAALAMVYAGARSETAKEMADVLHFELPEAQLAPAFESLQKQLVDSPDETQERLYVANRLWGQKSYEFLPAFLEITRKYYGAELAQVDFVQHTEAARKEINDWVAEQTKQKIENLIPPNALSDTTRLVVTNAIYFKDSWERQFDPQFTQQAAFHLAGQKSVDVPLMARKASFGYANIGDVQLLELPYANDAFSMIVLLPKAADGLGTLEESLSPDTLQEWVGAMSKRSVQVFLPRFTLNAQFQLNGVLQAMGMGQLFQPDRADLSGMTGNRDLSVSAVIHKAYVQVDEEGTEAAAATGVIVGVRAAPIEPAVFRADHPFLFLIRENRTNSILFLGRVVDPSAK